MIRGAGRDDAGDVRGSMPPSISSRRRLPARSSSARTSRNFGLAARDERLAPEARVDRHHQHESTSPAMSSSTPTGVAGLITTPAFTPSALMAWTSGADGAATSTCTDHRLRPPTANASMYDRARNHQVDVERDRRDALIDCTTGGPIVMFGTKWPSITSTWIDRRCPAPRSRWRVRAPRNRLTESTERSGPLTGSPRAKSARRVLSEIQPADSAGSPRLRRRRDTDSPRRRRRGIPAA